MWVCVSPSVGWDNLWKWLCNLNTVEQIIVSAFSIKQRPYDKWNGVFVYVKYCGESKWACAKNIRRNPPNIYWYVIYITLKCPCHPLTPIQASHQINRSGSHISDEKCSVWWWLWQCLCVTVYHCVSLCEVMLHYVTTAHINIHCVGQC